MIGVLSAADPEIGTSFTWGYALGAVGFVAALIALGVLTWLFDRWCGANIRRCVSRALDNGDTRTADAADAMWDARNRPSVPRQLENQR